MAKKLMTQIKLQITGGAANPAPPVGPALGQHGVNIQGFCKEFNDKTQDRKGETVPVIINVYDDRSFTFILKVAPSSVLLAKAAGAKKGAGNPLKDKVGKITTAQLREVAIAKMPDLNTTDVEAAMRTMAGTARQMGIQIVD